jgi:cobalt/nickel transport system permease protein
VVAVVVACLSFLASPQPDGLERVATDQGFIGTALDPFYTILPDYSMPFIGNEVVSGIVAVIVGTLLVFAIATLVGRTVRRPRLG